MSCWDFSTHNEPAGEVCSYLQPLTQQTMCCHMFYSLRMFAVFSVVISTSGSLKYSDATHLPFSDPDRKHTYTGETWMKMLWFAFRVTVSDALRNKTKPTKKRKLHVWRLQSCSQVTLMFCDSYDTRGHELALPLFPCDVVDICTHTQQHLYVYVCVRLPQSSFDFWSKDIQTCVVPTGHEANSPQAWVQRHLHLHALVLLQDDALYHDQPVVCGHGHPHQQQPAGSKHCGQDGQRTAAAWTHLEGRTKGGKGVRREEELHVKAAETKKKKNEGKFGRGVM